LNERSILRIIQLSKAVIKVPEASTVFRKQE
jgi:hypothetical protein